MTSQAFKSNLSKLFILQKKAVRLITNSHYLTPSSPLFVKCNILPLTELIKLNTCIFMFNYHKGILPESFAHMFKTNSAIHSYPTRQSKDLHIPFSRLSFVCHSTRFVGVNEWNSLNQDIKSSTTLTRFKRLCKLSLYQSLQQ